MKYDLLLKAEKTPLNPTYGLSDAADLMRKVAEISLMKLEGDVTEITMDGEHGKLLIFKGPNGRYVSLTIQVTITLSVDC